MGAQRAPVHGLRLPCGQFMGLGFLSKSLQLELHDLELHIHGLSIWV